MTSKRAHVQASLWTVRNKFGQYVGSFYARSEDEAVGRLISSQSQTADFFRRSQPVTVKRDDFTAKVEN